MTTLSSVCFREAMSLPLSPTPGLGGETLPSVHQSEGPGTPAGGSVVGARGKAAAMRAGDGPRHPFKREGRAPRFPPHPRQ